MNTILKPLDFSQSINTILHWFFFGISKPLKMVYNLPFPYRGLVILGLIISMNLMAHAQQAITLQQCYQSADSLYPIGSQAEQLAAIAQYEEQKLKAGYLPTLDLNGKVSYQSKVTEVPVKVPGIQGPSVPHEQYGATVDVGQLLYDGGTIKRARALNEAKSAVEIQQIRVDQFKLKDQINDFYFGIIMLQENLKVLDLTSETLSARRKVVASAVSQGTVQASELDNLDAEALKIEQQVIELKSQKAQILMALSTLTCLPIQESSVLEMPVFTVSQPDTIIRPELDLFAMNEAMLDANIKLTNTQRLPKVRLFSSAGMGYPGLDMFSGQLEPYYIVGAQASWKIWDWKQTKHTRQQLTLQKELVDTKREMFNLNLSVEQSDANNRINKQEQLISKDIEIVTLRERVTNRSAAQLENGTKTSADYIADLNLEKQARISLAVHQVMLVQAKADAFLASGQTKF
jgi:outer membrane protein TolC